jgi:flavin-dependent thymidylate synthase
MLVVTKPTIRVIGKPQFIENPDFLIPDDGTDGEKIGAYAAKRCYRSKGKDGRANLANQRAVVSSKHGSVLAHMQYVLDISGITRAASLELNRHGLNISQESTRYADFENGEGSIVLEPYYAALWKKHGFTMENNWIMIDGESYHPDITPYDAEQYLVAGLVEAARDDFQIYKAHVEQLMKLNPKNLKGVPLRKWARGKARNVLPNGLETAGVWSAGLRMWRNVIEQRSDRHAEPEIRRLAEAIFEALQPLAPVYFEDYIKTVGQDLDWITEYKTPYTKI